MSGYTKRPWIRLEKNLQRVSISLASKASGLISTIKQQVKPSTGSLPASVAQPVQIGCHSPHSVEAMFTMLFLSHENQGLGSLIHLALLSEVFANNTKQQLYTRRKRAENSTSKPSNNLIVLKHWLLFIHPLNNHRAKNMRITMECFCWSLVGNIRQLRIPIPNELLVFQEKLGTTIPNRIEHEKWIFKSSTINRPIIAMLGFINSLLIKL